MNVADKLLKNKLVCSSCNRSTMFLLVDDVECDYGIHTLIQCPKCQELFSIDGPCNAFESLLMLVKFNPKILSDDYIRTYATSVHPCNPN
ncbi:MAG: hypothetical protein R3327_06620 [Nitrosopumilaceae archaeon]|nr:hypothetical protein [Nitrosopumilaceae archaeon]